MFHLWCSILLIASGTLIRLAKCQFPQYFGQQPQQWYPQQQQVQWVPWQLQQQQQVVQQPWHHHHHHHHPPPPPVIVHDDHDDDHHHHHNPHHDDHHHQHHFAHYAPIRNNNNNDNDANADQQQQAVIPYRQEQFSPLGADLTEVAGTSSPEFQEQLPELYRPPNIEHLQTVQQPQHQHQQQQPNANGGSINNANFSHKKQQQLQPPAVAQSNIPRPAIATAAGGAVPAAQPAAVNNNNGGATTAARRRITTTSVWLPAAGPTLVNNHTTSSNNGNKFGGNNGRNNIQQQQQLHQRKLLLPVTPTTTTTTTTTTAPATRAVLAKAKVVPKNPALLPPAIAPPPKHRPHSQAVPARQQPIGPAFVTEFDLPPPPPPSRFLPDVEKARIDELLRQKSHHNFRQGVDGEDNPSDAFTKFPTLLSPFSTLISNNNNNNNNNNATEPATEVTTARSAATTSTLGRLLTAGSSSSTTASVPSQKNPNESFLHCCRAKRVPKTCESRCNFDVLNKKILTALFLNTDKCPSENAEKKIALHLGSLIHGPVAAESRVVEFRSYLFPLFSFDFRDFEIRPLARASAETVYAQTHRCIVSRLGLELFTCAAQDSDHTECCKAKRVQRTSAGAKCLAFCNLSPDAPRVQADASYLPCWAVLNEIKNCFREKLATNTHF